MNTKQIKETEAIVRNEAWAQLTPEQQIADLDRRLGKGVGAKKQRARIQYKINNPQVEISSFEHYIDAIKSNESESHKDLADRAIKEGHKTHNDYSNYAIIK